MKKERSVRLSKGLGKYFIIPVLALWLFSMWLLTWAEGKDLYLQLEKGADLWAAETRSSYDSVRHDVRGETEYRMFDCVTSGTDYLTPESLSTFLLPKNRQNKYLDNLELFYGYQAAMGFYDDNNEEILASGNYLLISYTDDISRTGYTYIDLDTLPGGKALADQYIDPGSGFDFSVFMNVESAHPGHQLKLTGYFLGNQFIPYEIFIHNEVIYRSDTYTGQARTLLPRLIYGSNYKPGKSFYLNGTKYENAAALLEADVESSFGMLNAVIIREFPLSDGTGTWCRIAVRCCPLVYAVRRLWPVYLVTFLLTALFAYRLWRRVHRGLIRPLTSMTDDLVVGRIPPHYFSASPFAELQELRDNIHTVQKDRQQAKNQVQQLQTALNYAKNAEESRRKLLSAMAHELKTPLAVLQSYAEGLQSGIAAEKQEKYLSVIREETALMDAMVLEMLDFSRLEAGKVQLQLQPVSLPALTQRIFEKLETAAQKKHLQIAFDMPPEFTVQADEVRIGQVITNFATNAVKYTPDGGSIRVSLSWVGSSARFAIENDSPPLSEEALKQVWDSFYRADSARDRSGTGLGLSIAKSIVELHRGSCGVKNTHSGVEFHFCIPV